MWAGEEFPALRFWHHGPGRQWIPSQWRHLAPATPPCPLLHNFLFPASFSSDTVINNLQGWPLGLSLGEPEESRGDEDGALSCTWPGGHRVSGCSGEFCFLVFSTREWGSERGNNLCWLEDTWPPLGWCWVTPARSCCSAGYRSQGHELRGLERRHLRIHRGPGDKSAGPVAFFPSPGWFHMGG